MEWKKKPLKFLLAESLIDTEPSCDQFTSRKCLISDNEIISQNKNNPQTSTFKQHSAVWQLMNETLRRCLCTFIIYYTTLGNKTTANDKLMLSQLCSLCNDTFHQGSASLPTNLPVGGKREASKGSDLFQQLSNEWQQLCLHKEAIHTEMLFSVCTCQEQKHKCHPWYRASHLLQTSLSSCIPNLYKITANLTQRQTSVSGSSWRTRFSPPGTKHQAQPVTHLALHMSIAQREISRCSFQHVTNPTNHSKRSFS